MFRVLPFLLVACILAACGGGGGSSKAPPQAPRPDPQPTPAGCSVAVAADPGTRAWPTPAWQSRTAQSQGLCPDELDSAFEYAFQDGNDTGAVVVIRNGFIVAEQYADGRTPDDRVTSWSVAKSITSALVGAALDAGYIGGLDQSLADFIPAWAATDKAAITLHHLLTVRTAMQLLRDDDGDGVPDGGDLYAAEDQLALSLSRPLVGTPGEQVYVYSNADVMIAGEVLRVATGVSANEFLALGVGKVIGFDGEWWVDATGQVMSYCCLDATPRHFARFGLLFSRNGDWDGRRVLSEAWMNQSTLPAKGGNYGFYWWPIGNNGFAALGVMGQLIAVYPDDDLVVLRFGNYTRVGDGRAVKEGNNYHATTQPRDFDPGVFLGLVRDALPDGGTNPMPPNQAPRADAGLNQIAQQGSTVTLFGGRSGDPDGGPIAFDWELLDSPAGSSALIRGIGDTVTFVADVSGRYVVDLTVSDGLADSVTDRIEIDVVAQRSLLTDGTTYGMWPTYAGNLSSSKYSPLAQINKDNVDDVEIVWRWRSPDNDVTTAQNSVFEATPLMIDGVLYTSTSFSQVAAIDAQTGGTLWVHDSKAYNYGRPPNNGFLHRGVSYAEANGAKTIFMPTGDARLLALNAVSGQPVRSFGALGNGSVDLLDDVPRLNADTTRLDDVHDQPDVPDMAGVVTQVGNTSPGTLCRGVLILGSSVHDGEVLPPSPPGDVRGFDPTTGELLWTFHTVPREGEFGVDTWANESWKTNGNTNVWAPMSADEALGYVYLPVSCPTNNYYGGRRHGDNLFANSVVALRCETGERVWHFQTVHHDIWDYDLPAAPNLLDITVDGQSIKALAQVSKQGFVYVFDRRTGEPVWPIVETPVPPSTVPGELAAATQPIPTRPPPFVRQGSDVDDLIDPASAAGFDTGPLFTPPTQNGVIVTPGEGGGANWGGASYDPTSQMLYVNGFGPLTHLVALQYGGQPNFYYVFPELFFGPNTGSPYIGAQGSSITAYDMNAGSILWQVPGDANATVIGNSGSMIAGELLYYKNSSLTTLNVFDKSDGELLRAIPLGGRPTGVPMTYQVGGKQYVVVALGRQDELTELVALALPE